MNKQAKLARRNLRAAYTAAPVLRVPTFARLADYVGVWAIDPNAGAALWQSANKLDLRRHVAANLENPPEPAAAMDKVPDGRGKSIAVIQIAGTLMKAVPSMSEGSSTVAIRRELRKAAADQDVAAILLAIDSPGGTVSGTADLAADVLAARKQKPVFAQVEDLGASSAYWIASQAEKVYANAKTALVGSIGTYLTVYDLSGHAEKEGIKALVFATGPLKGAGVPGSKISDDQAEHFQSLVDDLQVSFDAAVRSGRGLTQKQLADVKSGAAFPAAEAMTRGLIDGIQSMDATLSQLATAARKKPSNKGTAGTTPTRPVMEVPSMFEQWLSLNGFDAADLDDTQLATLRRQFDAEQRAAVPAAPIAAAVPIANADQVDPVAEMREKAATEARRQETIRNVCAKYGDVGVTFLAPAIAEGWDENKVELECMRAARPSPNVIVRNRDDDYSLDALQGAIILRAGGRLDHPSYQTAGAAAMGIPSWLRAGINNDAKNRAMEWAHKCANMSMMDIVHEACRLDGKTPPKYNHAEAFRMALSGGNLTAIFTTNVNTILLSTYMEIGDTTVGWTRESEVANFLTNERPRMVKGPDLERLPSGGTANHASRDDTQETFKIARYAKQFQLDEQDFINDNFQALADVPVEMGRAAARVRPDLVYGIILNNANLATTSRALFNATDGNLDTSSALAATTLKAAITAMMSFQENGVNLGLRPTHLIVPTNLWFTAGELLHSAEIRAATGERGTRNVIADENLTRVGDPRLDNGLTDPATATALSGSTTTWYLASSQGHTIEVAYRRGTGRMPTVRSFNLDRGQWGLGWDVAHDLGAKALDWRALHRSDA